MGKKLIPILTDIQLKELEKCYRESKNHALRQRSHIILLKSQGHSSKYISTLSGYPSHQGTINGWVSRYLDKGIAGLKNKLGQGRKKIINQEAHEAKIKEIVKTERQRLTYAKSLIEKELDVKMSKRTLTRFLKTLAGSISE
jgi:transposase